MGKDLANGAAKLIHGDGFDDDGVKRRNRIGFFAGQEEVGRNGDNGQILETGGFVNAMAQIIAAHLRNPDVGQNKIDGLFVQQFDGFLAGQAGINLAESELAEIREAKQNLQNSVDTLMRR